MWSKVYRVAFIALAIWAVVSIFIIFRGSATTDISAIGNAYLSDITAFARDSHGARIRADSLAESNRLIAERSVELEKRAINAEKSVIGIESRFREYRESVRGSGEGNSEIGSIGRELESLIQDVPGFSGDKNKAP